MIPGRFFVSPHAVDRFRERIAPHLSEAEPPAHPVRMAQSDEEVAL